MYDQIKTLLDQASKEMSEGKYEKAEHTLETIEQRVKEDKKKLAKFLKAQSDFLDSLKPQQK